MHIYCMNFLCINNTNKTPQNNLSGYCNLNYITITKSNTCGNYKKEINYDRNR